MSAFPWWDLADELGLAPRLPRLGLFLEGAAKMADDHEAWMFCPSCDWRGPLAAADYYEGQPHCPRCIAEVLKPCRGVDSPPSHPRTGSPDISA